MTTSSPNKVYSNTAERSAKILAADKKRKATEAVKERRRKSKYATKCDTPAACSAYSRHDGGIFPDQVTEDLSPEHLQELNSSFYATRVFVTQEEREQIEEQTRDQDNSDQWQQERRKRLTASVVGGIGKMKEKTQKKTEARKYKHYCIALLEVIKRPAMALLWKLYPLTDIIRTTRRNVPSFVLTRVGCLFLKHTTG